MKRFSISVLAIFLLACGGAGSGPSDVFTGTWAGNAFITETDTALFSVTTSQNGTVVTGVGTYTQGTNTYGADVNGISTPPHLTLTIAVSGQSFSYVGTYVTSDSVAGTITLGATSLPLSLKKQ